MFFIAAVNTDSIFMISLTAFTASLSSFLLSSRIGVWMDDTNRLKAVQIALAVKLISVTCAYIICSAVVNTSQSGENSKYLYLLPVCYSFGQLAFSTITLCVEKDWVVVMTEGDQANLSTINSTMTMIDLSNEALAPVVAGLLFQYSVDIAGIVLVTTNIVGGGTFWLFLRGIYRDYPALASPRGNRHSSTESPPDIRAVEVKDSQPSSTISSRSSSVRFVPIVTLRQLRETYLAFISSGCVSVMLAFAFLFVTVLSYGAVMTVWLLYAGIEPAVVGGLRAISALSGFSGAAVYPMCRKRWGIYNTGLVAVWLQAVCVVVGSLALGYTSLVSSSRHAPYLYVFIIGTLLSRAGLWTFDLVARQMAQETIPDTHRGRVNGTWNAIVSLCDLTAYGLGMVLASAKEFWLLAAISAIFVCLAAIVYSSPGHTDSPSSGRSSGIEFHNGTTGGFFDLKDSEEQEDEEGIMNVDLLPSGTCSSSSTTLS